VIPAVYLHIPFCLSKCGYCAFYSVAYRRMEIQRYGVLITRELELFRHRFEIKPDTVYFGGGTPALLTADQINEIMSVLNPGSKMIDRALCQDAPTNGQAVLLPQTEGAGSLRESDPTYMEITLEINPIQITDKFLKELNRTPVNRLSIGIQSLNDEKLSCLGRKHRGGTMKQMMKMCREYGYDNVSVDLMYGLPGEDSPALAGDIDRLLELEPEHISAYLLSLEPGTPLVEAHPKLPPDEELAAQYDLIRNKLVKAGFYQYEISNFAQPGCESKHNLHYWEGDDYLGLGASASGLIRGVRYTNPMDLALYGQQIEAGSILPGAEHPDPEQQRTDYLIMAFRLRRGIRREDYRRRFGNDILADYRQVFDRKELKGMFEIDDTAVRLSETALFVSNRVLEEFV